MKTLIRSLVLGLGAAAWTAAAAAPPQAYLQRVTADYRNAMQSCDANRDGTLTREEARTSTFLMGAFDFIDIDGSGAVTGAEMDRFLAALPAHPQYM